MQSTFMQESENSGVKTCQAFSMRQLNEKLARSPEEVELFNRLDGEADLWPGTLTSANETPPWIRFLAADRDGRERATALVAALGETPGTAPPPKP